MKRMKMHIYLILVLSFSTFFLVSAQDKGTENGVAESIDRQSEYLEHRLDQLSKSIDDLITDSPRTELAATRFKKILLKVGEPAALALRELIVDIVSSTAKKLIFG